MVSVLALMSSHYFFGVEGRGTSDARTHMLFTKSSKLISASKIGMYQLKHGAES
jgi:hypothetical protein